MLMLTREKASNPFFPKAGKAERAREGGEGRLLLVPPCRPPPLMLFSPPTP